MGWARDTVQWKPPPPRENLLNISRHSTAQRDMQYLSDETSSFNCNKFLLLLTFLSLINNLQKKPAKPYCYDIDQPANIDVNYSVFQ